MLVQRHLRPASGATTCQAVDWGRSSRSRYVGEWNSHCGAVEDGGGDYGCRETTEAMLVGVWIRPCACQLELTIEIDVILKFTPPPPPLDPLCGLCPCPCPCSQSCRELAVGGLHDSPAVPDRPVLVEDVLVGHMARVVQRHAPIPSAAAALLPRVRWWQSRATEASALPRRVRTQLRAGPRCPSFRQSCRHHS